MSKPSFLFRSPQKRCTTANSLSEIHRTTPYKLNLTPDLDLIPDLNLVLTPDFNLDLVISLICTAALSSICHG
jgi:hypothetical protein